MTTPSIKALLKRLPRALVLYLVFSNVLAIIRHIRARGIVGSVNGLYNLIAGRVVKLLLRLPQSQAKVQAELSTLRQDLHAKLAPPRPDLLRPLVLPEIGLQDDELYDQLDKLKGLDTGEYQAGKVSGAVYDGGEVIGRIISKSFDKFSLTNPLHPDVFPATRKMEAEVVAMVLSLYNAPPDAAGTTTSGGTESILVACKTYKDWAYETKGITRPEMIIPQTAHAAFNKASDYFGIKLHQIPVDPLTRRVNLKLVKRAINGNTIMLVGSAPNFSDGTIDDISSLGAMAAKAMIGMHVDACLGSFIMPFIEKAGFTAPPPFDFRVPGVTSISCDTHKYGFAPKGSSVIMYRSRKLRSFQFYVLEGWTGGLYASPTLAGSRPGALIAGCWSVMMHMGTNGYLKSCKAIVGARLAIQQGIEEQMSDELYIIGRPLGSVVAFGSKSEGKSDGLSILQIGDVMGKKGYHLSALSSPPGLHMACTMLTVPAVPQLLADLKATIQEVKVANQEHRRRIANGEETEKEGQMVALYGLGQSRIGRSVVTDIAKVFLETLYEA